MKTPIHILFLEDDPDDAVIIQSTLAAEGVPCAATCVQSREDFVAALEKGNVDVVLSDSALPTFDGMAALNIVRARWPSIPLIFVSGTPGEERAIELMKSGATDYVLKHRLGRLAPAVRRALEEAQEGRRDKVAAAPEANQRLDGDLEPRVSREEFRSLSARIQEAREEERTRLAREIHDVLAQELTGLKMDVAWLGRRLAEPIDAWKQTKLQEKVDAMQELADTAIRSVQRIAAELRPVVLDSLGLCAATEWVAADFQRRTEIICQTRVPKEGLTLDRDRSTALFRILQESLTNIRRHAGATKAEIHLWQEGEEVRLNVCDNGRGIKPTALRDPGSLGLLGMRERAALLRGHCSVQPQSGGGTRVEVRIPRVSPQKKTP